MLNNHHFCLYVIFYRYFCIVMANKESNQQNNPNLNWGLILKVTIAVLTAIAGAIGVSRSEAVADVVGSIIDKEG